MENCMTAKKWLDSIEKQKRRSDLKEQRETYRHTSRRLDPALSANVVAMVTKIGPLVVSPGRHKHIRSIWHTSRVIGDFVQVQILGSKFWALGGLNQKSKKKFCRVSHGKLTGKKMARFHQKQKKEEAI